MPQANPVFARQTSREGLVMDAPPERGARPAPERPTLIPPLPAAPVSFRSIAELATHVQRQRRGRGLELRAGHASLSGSDTFPIFNLYWQTPDTGALEWAFAIACQTAHRETLEAALAAANPDLPKAFATPRAGARR